jgi:hypothetical protein
MSEIQPEPGRLPMRWALILLAAVGVGVLTFVTAGPAAALMAVLTAIGVLHATVA